MPKGTAKTLQEVSLAIRRIGPKLIENFEKYGGTNDPSGAVQKWAETLDPKKIDKVIKKTKELKLTESQRADVLQRILDHAIKNKEVSKEQLKLIQDQIKKSQDLVTAEKKRKENWDQIVKSAKTLKPLLDKAVKSNKEIYEISHKMQLESNVTWKNFQKLYDGAYQATRDMNKEIEKSVHNVKDMVNTQNRLLGTGWRNMNPSDLTAVAGSVMNLSKTLGVLDENLVMAFQNSFRIFGSQTEQFITAMGNRLNAFSDTFGISMGMLQGTVAQMMDSNNFIARSNMNVQMAANENLMRATALSASLGMTTTTFITNLAKTAQFGTMEEMSELYSGGAMIDGFDTGDFQSKMQNQDYTGATSDLFAGISRTLNNIDDQYVRAEYMKRIGGSFGFSNDEMLRIATHGDNLGAYEDNLAEKLKNVNTSMNDELKDLHMTVKDRLDNWFEGSGLSQGLGQIMNEFGLYGLADPMWQTARGIQVLILQNSSLLKGFMGGGGAPGFGATGGWLGAASGTAKTNPMVLSNGTRLAGGLGGLAVAGGTNYMGHKMLVDGNKGNDFAGGAMNVLGGAAGGAMIGSMILPGVGTAIGAGVGAIAGGVNTYLSKKEGDRKYQENLATEEAERRRNARAVTGAGFITDDPVVNAINSQTAALVRTLDGNYAANRQMYLTDDQKNKTKVTLLTD